MDEEIIKELLEAEEIAYKSLKEQLEVSFSYMDYLQEYIMQDVKKVT